MKNDRDKIIHDYFGVNLKLVWASTRGSMKVYGERVAAMLDQLDQQGDLPL